MAMVLLLNVVVGVFSVSLMLFYELSLLLEPYFAWKINRRKSMLKFYPEFQKHMFELKLYMAETKANPISSIDLRIASNKYLLYKSSPEEYRSFLTMRDIGSIPLFSLLINCIKSYWTLKIF